MWVVLRGCGVGGVKGCVVWEVLRSVWYGWC